MIMSKKAGLLLSVYIAALFLISALIFFEGGKVFAEGAGTPLTHVELQQEIDNDTDGVLELKNDYVLAQTVNITKDITIIVAADKNISIGLAAGFSGRHFIISGEISVSADGGTGGITLSGHNERDPEPAQRFEGGGIVITGGADAELTGVHITGCASFGWLGGGLLIEDGANASIKNCVLDYNFISGYGGGLCADWAGEVSVSDCRIENNSAAQGGGGVNFGGEGNHIIENSALKANRAQNGGGLFCWNPGADKGAYLIEGCTFTENTSDKSGGAVYLDNGGYNGISGCLFDKNASTLEQGGAVYADCKDVTVLLIENSRFSENAANGTGNGGAVFISGGQKNTVLRCGFDKNETYHNGGAICLTSFDNNDTARLNVAGCAFYKNKAAFYGGAGIYAFCVDSVTVLNSTFALNEVADSGPQYPDRGAAINISGGKLKLLGSAFAQNTVRGKLCTSVNNHAVSSVNNGTGFDVNEPPPDSCINLFLTDGSAFIDFNADGGSVDFLVPLKGGPAHNQIDESEIALWALDEEAEVFLALDLLGRTRKVGAAMDIGACEYSKLTVEFISDGLSVASGAFDPGAKADNIPPVEKTGHTLAGWYSDETCLSLFDISNMPIESDTVLYAKWEKNRYTVTFDTNGGSKILSASVLFSEKTAPPAPPIRKGYTFNKWYGDEKLETPFDFENTAITANTVLFAKWDKKPFPVYATALIITGGGLLVLFIAVVAFRRSRKVKPELQAARTSLPTAITLSDPPSDFVTNASLPSAFNQFENGKNTAALLNTLTLREREILDLLLEGLTLRQISGHLGISYDTVHSHYKNIYEKLEVSSRAELLIKYKKSV